MTTAKAHKGARLFAALFALLVLVAASIAASQAAAARGCVGLPQREAVAAPPPGRGPGGHDFAAARAAAAAVAAPDRSDRQARLGAPHGIPRILHRIFMSDPADQRRSNLTHPIAHKPYVDSCMHAHSRHAGWTLMYWDWHNVHALLDNHFPWLAPFYRRNATKMVEKSDLARYAILHRVGGLYLDSDIECWREGGDMLEGFDFVAQSTNGAEGTTNAMIAARPGLPVFVKALQIVQTRVGKNGTTLGVIMRTANGLLADALSEVGLKRDKGLFPLDSWVQGAVYRLHLAGTWYHPCQWWEVDCRRRLYMQRAAGRADMTSLVGWHRMVGSWIAGKEDGIGIVNATAELCGGASHVRGNGQVGGWVAPNLGQQAKPGAGQQQRQEGAGPERQQRR